MAVEQEDMRTAVGIQTELSSYLVTAALAILGAQAAIVTFVIDKRSDLRAFFVVSGIACLLLTLSIFSGGKGIAAAYKSGFRGDWKIGTSAHQFQWQALLALLGLLFVVSSVFMGSPQRDENADQVLVKESMARIQRDLTDLKAKNSELSAAVQELTKLVAAMPSDVLRGSKRDGR